ncbi:MAG: phosphoribosylformylglycinamidine synthase subunit PurS [Bacteroidetes bacterium]|nr:phosphoribosylformylglycinamidine synthase subunit PurS [Bacteroidota bacterium]MBS1739516.1 phosphoribosylformylglycinamidine synthase subunit PurS [Bacteroidota bacterium]MBS1777417.1 phosphoribosylformylglycinamidine synthase subunit PurS [Bacteroidota bacterium]
MTFTAHINIMPLKELLDPQGKAVNSSLHNLGLTGVQDVRVGKHITLKVEAADKQSAENITNEACKKLLVNQVMEGYDFTIVEG